jgi:hypothetical protein
MTISIALLSNSLFGISYLEYIFFIPIFFYDLICESLWQGKTIGKYFMKIRVLRVDGTEPTFVHYFLRWIFRPIEIWICTGGIAAISIFINGKGQRIGDLAAGTSVVSLRDEVKLSDTLLTGYPENYQPEFIEVNNLNDNDIKILKDILKANKLPDIPSVVIDANYKAKSIIEAKMGIKSEKQPLDFINKVIYDYNYYNSIQ